MANKKIFAIGNTYAVHHSHALFLNSAEFSVVTIEEDDMPSQYFFFSEYLTELDDVKEIWGKGLFLLNLYNGAVNINQNGNDFDSKVEFRSLHDWNTNEELTPLNTNEILPVNPFAENLVTDNQVKQHLKAIDFIAYAVFLSKSEKDVQCLILLASNDLNWITLYCLLDTLKFYSQDFEALSMRCGYSKNAVKIFTGTANNFGLLGINARHGEMGWGNPAQTIDFKNAKRMILAITKQYISEK